MAEHNRQLFALLVKNVPALGVYATVVRGGRVRPGDPVRLMGRAPLRWVASVMHIVKRVLLRR